MTNGDKFRSMTNEELAEFMWEYIACLFCPIATKNCAKDRETCINTWTAHFAEKAQDENSVRYPSMLYFSQRFMIQHAFENWCRANGAAITPMNMVAFLQDKQLIKLEETHIYLKDKQGLKTDDWKKAGF